MGIGLRGEAGLDLHPDLSRRLPPGQLRRHLEGDVAHVGALAHELPPADPGQAQEVVDELRHAQGARAHALEVVASALVELGGVVVEDRLAESIDGPQGSPQVVRHRVRERFQLLVRGREVAGAGLDAPLEVRVGLLEVGVLPLDLVQHLVERRDEEADLVAASRLRPHRVVLLRGDGARGVGQPDDGTGDRPRHETRDPEREQEGAGEDREDDAGVAALAVPDLREVGLDDERAERPALEPDRFGHDQAVGGEDGAGAGRRGKLGRRARRPVAEVGRERPVVALGADRRGHDGRLGPQAPQRGGGGLGVVEQEGRDAVEAHDLGVGEDAAGEGLPDRVDVVGEERDARGVERGEAREHRDARQLLPDRHPPEEPHLRGRPCR